MLHSLKFRIPAIVVKTRQEVLADRRQHVIDKVLANPRLNSNQKMRLFESALYRKLVDEHKFDELPPPSSKLYDYEEKMPLEQDDTRTAIENDTTTAIEDDTRTAIEDDTAIEEDAEQVDDRRPSIAFTVTTPKNEKILKSGFVPVQGDLPGYMQPLKRDSLATSPVSSRLRENRPPPGHFIGKGRLRVVRW